MMRTRENAGRARIGVGPIRGNRGTFLVCSPVFRDLWGKSDPARRLDRRLTLNKINVFPSFP